VLCKEKEVNRNEFPSDGKADRGEAMLWKSKSWVETKSKGNARIAKKRMAKEKKGRAERRDEKQRRSRAGN